MNMQNKLYTIQFSHHPRIEINSIPAETRMGWRESAGGNKRLVDFISRKLAFY